MTTSARTVEDLMLDLENPKKELDLDGFIKLGLKALPQLKALLLNGCRDRQVHKKAIQILCVIGPSKKIVTLLTSLLKGHGKENSRDAAEALIWMGDEASAAIPNLIEVAFLDPTGYVFREAIASVIEIGFDPDKVKEGMEKATKFRLPRSEQNVFG